jgi:hypothetical protein
MGAAVQLATFTDVPHYTVQVTIEEQVFTLRFQWNTRELYWYAHLLDEDEATQIAGGQKVIPFVGDPPDGLTLDDVRSLALFPRQFPGVLAAFATEPLRKQQDDLDRISLIYTDAAGVSEIVAGAIAAGDA